MQEYWVNVYEPPNWATSIRSKHNNKADAILASYHGNNKTLYRIHVKMKERDSLNKPIDSGMRKV